MSAPENEMPPVMDLLLELRAASVPVDIQKSLLLLRSFAGGFGTDYDSLRRLLHALFSSNSQERRAVDLCYSRFLERIRRTGQGDAFSDMSNGPTESDHRTATNDREKSESEVDVSVMSVDARDTGWRMTGLMDPSGDIDEAELIEASGIGLSLRDYLPISKRQMRQHWRYLRVPVREGPKVEISVRETLAKAARQGALIEPVMVPRRVSRSELVLLVDVRGSMTPFHEVSRRLIQTAQDGGRFRSVRALYFHNAPRDRLMTSPGFVDAVSLSDFLTSASPRWCSIVVVSDAGAARGTNNPRRVEATRRFLDAVYHAGFRLVWLNPVPRSRWEGTSALTISRHVSMHEISRPGVDHAVAVLKRPRRSRELWLT